MLGAGADRRHPQPHQPHHVVDAHAASVGEVGAKHLYEGTVAMGLESPGGEGGNAPALPVAIEDVRWRAHAQGGQHFVLPAPGLAAAAVGAHGQVADQPDGHARAARRRLCTFQAAGDEPLAECVEAHFVGVFFGEALHGRVFRRAVLLGPLPPMLRVTVLVEQGGVQSFEPAMVLQRLATGFAEAGEVLPQGIAAGHEVFIERAQQALTRLGHGRPIDQIECFELPQRPLEPAGFDGQAQRFFAENGARRGVQDVVEEPTGGRIGAVLIAAPDEHGVQRADAQRVRPMCRGTACQGFQRQGIAQATVAGAPQAIELDGDAPGRLAGDILHAGAGRGRDGEGQLLPGDLQLVVTGHVDGGQVSMGIQLARLPGTLFELQLVRRVGVEEVLQAQRNSLVRRDQRRKVSSLVAKVKFLQALFDVLFRFGAQAEAGEYGA